MSGIFRFLKWLLFVLFCTLILFKAVFMLVVTSAAIHGNCHVFYSTGDALGIAKTMFSYPANGGIFLQFGVMGLQWCLYTTPTGEQLLKAATPAGMQHLCCQNVNMGSFTALVLLVAPPLCVVYRMLRKIRV